MKVSLETILSGLNCAYNTQTASYEWIKRGFPGESTQSYIRKSARISWGTKLIEIVYASLT